MTLPNGYVLKSTFMNDFAIAERFGAQAVKDTFDRAFAEWKDNPTMLAELAVVTNTRCWDTYEKQNDILSGMYSGMYYKCTGYAYDGTKSDAFVSIFFNIVD